MDDMKNTNYFKFVVISDIHFGKKDSKLTYDMLRKEFVDYCYQYLPDLIIIAGDLFDKRFGLHSDVSEYANRFISDLVDLINDSGASLWLIHGTMSHDNLQLKSFKHYLSDDRIKIFEKVSEENFFGYSFLIMPEEYVPLSYYKPFLKNKHDFIVGHGMFDFATVVTAADKKRKTEVLNSKMFSDNVNQMVYFGHVHTHQKHNKIMYTGSFDRLAFGEEEPKGFVSCFIDARGSVVTNFIENVSAQKYTSINAVNIPDNMEESLSYMKNILSDNDYLRIVIDSDISDEKLNNIIGFVKSNEKVSILKKVVGTKSKEEVKVIEERVRELENKLKAFENMNFIEITKKIGKDDYNMEFTTDEILEIMEKK